MTNIENLVKEIDINVKRIMEIFRFIFKYKIIFRGQGIEFAGLSEYTPSDDAKFIDWKASARLNKLYVKLFEEERDLNIILVLDISNSMLFGTTEKTKIEYSSILAGTIAFAGTEVGDNVALCLFNDEIKKFIPPSKTKIQYFQILKEMVNKENHGGGFDLNNALDFLGKTVGKKSVIIIISDFIGPENWKEKLKSTRYKFESLIGIMVRDPRDDFLPEGVGNIKLKDPYSNRFEEVNLDKYKNRFEEEVKINEKKIKQTFINSNAGFVKTYTNKPFIEPLIKYFSSI